MFRVQGYSSVEQQRWFGKSDDQYGTYDLRTSGPAAGSGGRQGFEVDALCLCKGRCKDI